MEFKIIKQEVGAIEFNFEEMKSKLEIELKKYDGLVIADESQVKEIKSLKANLNKVKKAVNDEKIRIKKQYCIPLVEFEDNIKTLTGMIERVVNPIDQQIKAFEELKKEQKKQEIIEYWNSKEFDLVPLEKVFDERWLNATNKEYQKSIDDFINKVNKDLDLIELMSTADGCDTLEYQSRVKARYLVCLDIALAKQQIDNEIRQSEEFKRRNEEYQKRLKEEQEKEEVVEVVEHETQETDTKYYVTLEFVFDSVDDIKKKLFLEFIKENNLTFSVLQKGEK